MSFHNPYNFVPAPPRGDLPDGLRNRAPAGHHLWHPELWSGRIGVTVTTKSPLLIVEDQQPTATAVLQLRAPRITDPDGQERVDIAPTQIKGMLRSAFEAVTNSRFGIVSRSHDAPLHYRSSASSGSGLQPVVVTHPPEGPALHVGGRLVVPGLESLPGTVLQAWIPASSSQRTPSDLLAGSRPNRAALAHGQHVEAVVEQRTISVPGPRGTTTEMARWHVVDAAPVGALPLGGLNAAPAGSRWAHVTGYLHITGPTIEGKRYERLFLQTCVNAHPDVEFEPPNVVEDGADDLLRELQRLIDDQRAAHKAARKDEVWQRSDGGDQYRPWDYFGREHGKTAWARHLYDVAAPTENIRGFSVLFRQFHSDQEPASFSAAQGALRKLNEKAADDLAELRNKQLQAWGKASRRLRGTQLAVLVGRRMQQEGLRSLGPLPNENAETPELLISVYNYGEYIHWGRQREQVVLWDAIPFDSAWKRMLFFERSQALLTSTLDFRSWSSQPSGDYPRTSRNSRHTATRSKAELWIKLDERRLGGDEIGRPRGSRRPEG